MKKTLFCLTFALCFILCFGRLIAFSETSKVDSYENHTILNSDQENIGFSDHLYPYIYPTQSESPPKPQTQIESSDNTVYPTQFWLIVGIATAAACLSVVVLIVVVIRKKKAVAPSSKQPPSSAQDLHQSKTENATPAILMPTTTPTKLCPRCEKIVEHDAAFCGHCGNTLW